MKIKAIIIRLALSFAFLFSGLLIYLATRTGTYVNAMFDSLISVPAIAPDTVINTVIYNWGADFLWVVSFTLALSCFVEKPIIAAGIVAGLGVLFEFFQLFGITTGTFDIFDIVAELLGATIVFAGVSLWGKKLNNKE